MQTRSHSLIPRFLPTASLDLWWKDSRSVLQRHRRRRRPCNTSCPSAPAPRLLRVTPSLRRLSSPRNLHLPLLPLSLPGFSRREGVPALLDATPSQSGRAPNLGWRWTPCLQRLLDLQSRKRRGPSPVAAGLPTKRPLLNLFSPH